MKRLSAHPTPPLGPLLHCSSAVQHTVAVLQAVDLELTYNARGALLQVSRELGAKAGDEVLVPAYHCPSGVMPVIEAGLRPVFYRIRPDLSIDLDDLRAKLGPRSRAVIVIHFFGFAVDLAPLQDLRSKGIALIEDWSHSFLQGSPAQLPTLQGDVQVFSFWKLVPSGVGGAIRRGPTWRAAPALTRSPPPWRDTAVRFKRMLESAIEHSEHRRTKALMRGLESLRLALKPGPASAPAEALPPADADELRENAPPVPADSERGEDHYVFDLRLAQSAMPATALRILRAADLTAVAQRRRDNYDRYAELLNGNTPVQALFAQRPADCCPWVFPVLLPDRDRIDQHWRRHGVALHTFGIHLHSALYASGDPAMIADARRLAQEVLCLSIHQDLSPDQISASAHLIRTLPLPTQAPCPE